MPGAGSTVNPLIGHSHDHMSLISRASLIVGRTAAKDTTRLFAQAIVLTLIAVPLGIRLHLPGALATMALLLVMTVGRSVAAVNPVTYIVDAARALFICDVLNTSVLYGAVAAVAIAAIGLTLSTRVMKRGI